MTSRRSGLAILVTILVLTTACGGGAGTTSSSAPAASSAAAASSAPTATQSAFDKQWADLIAAAKKEGELSIVGGPEGSQQDGAWYDQFAKQYGIKVTLTGGAANDVANRMLAERAQNVYTIDIAGLGNSGTQRFLKADVLDPIAPLLIHPSVTDRSKGFEVSEPMWADQAQKYCQYVAIQALPNLGDFYYNSQKVSPAELDTLKSYKDLLDPRWKGRIVIGDISTGEASRDTTITWMVLGQSWFNTLMRTQAPHVATNGDERWYADGVARGDFSIAIFPPGTASLQQAGSQGLPVKYMERTLSEGPAVQGIQRICAMNKPPHPNATKLFVNWTLMKEGQTALNAFTNRTERASVRSDVPQGKVIESIWKRARTAGKFYSDTSPEYLKAEADAPKFLKGLFAELKIATDK